jgi:ankyrin repeat protein
MNAVYLNNVEMVKILLHSGADVNAKNYMDRSALFMAESLGHKEIEPLLKAAGAEK